MGRIINSDDVKDMLSELLEVAEKECFTAEDVIDHAFEWLKNLPAAKVYAIEMSNVDGVEFTCASSRSVAEDMKNALIEVGRYAEADFDVYQITPDHLEVLGNVVHFLDDEDVAWKIEELRDVSER